ncbi:PREDICTED: orexin receptor type 2-like [Acropora digitifera]|uniref:orexin receptor type 2-like n=1 Tax=Acropora digitifera TaxID=70779 RepID=UPI00077B1A66|nr:PREDICTED: orexin receptor type 2-like [Acropora digitifera]XP_015750549.1 PREDICTED: orexin receptor type 2-like [Acropora digitifera]
MSGNSTSNETSAASTTTASPGMSREEKAILLPFYCISLLVALIGNVLIIVVFYKYKPIRKSINYFVLNMAISDLFTPLTIMPFYIAKTLSNGAFLNQLPSSRAGVVCKFCFFLTDTSIVVSIISLLMISMDRLIAVVFPLQIKLISMRVRVICIFMSWVVALSVHVPYLFFYTFREGKCIKSWSVETDNRYVVATFTTFFLVPVCFFIIIYGAIVVTLQRRQRERKKMSESKKSRVHSGNRSVIGLSVAILVAFTISIGPLFVLQCIFFVFHGRLPPEVEKNPAILFIITRLLVHSWGAINPCMCFAFCENYRTGLKHVFFGGSRAGSPSLSANTKMATLGKRTRSSMA